MARHAGRTSPEADRKKNHAGKREGAILKTSALNKFLILSLAVNMLAVLIGGALYLRKGSSDTSPAVSGTPAPTDSPSGPVFSNPITARGGRLVAVEHLGSNYEQLNQARQALLKYLQSKRPADLQQAYQLFHELPNLHDWYELMFEAYCLELMGRTSERDSLMKLSRVDRDVYDFTFHGPHSSALQALISMQFDACVRQMIFIVQAIELYQYDHGGTPPPNLEALKPDYLDAVMACPCGGDYLYTVEKKAKGPGKQGVLGCDRHVSYGQPSLRGPGSLFGRRVALITENDHVWEQLEWKARRTEEDARNIFEALAKAAALKPNDVVADIGAGVGFYSYMMAERVAPRGEVWAVDVKPSVLEYVDFVNKRHPGTRVRSLVNRMNDVCLPAGKFDAVVVAHVYRRLCSTVRDEKEYRTIIRPFVASIHKALKPGGRLVIMDGEVNPTQSVLTVARATVVREVTPVGFEWVKDEGVDQIEGDTPHDYVMVFRKTAAKKSP